MPAGSNGFVDVLLIEDDEQILGLLRAYFEAKDHSVRSALDGIADDASAGNKPPTVSTGDATLFIASQDALRGMADNAAVPGLDVSDAVRFLAPDSSPFAYGAGVNGILREGDFGASFVSGKVGSEIAFITEAAEREQLVQPLSSDDMEALAIALAGSDDVAMGEELYAAAAYLQGESSHVASLQLQDILRIVVIVAILIAAIVSIFVN